MFISTCLPPKISARVRGRTAYCQAAFENSICTIATDYRDGGFFVEAGMKVVHGWWYFDDEGNKTNGILGIPLPKYKTIP